MGGAYSTHKRDVKCLQNFSWKGHEGKRSLDRTKHRWEDYVKEVHCEGVN
jgi:hypothetical protein